MDEVKDKLVKDVAELKQRVANQGEQLELQAAQLKLLTAPPPVEAATPTVETSKKRPFQLSRRGNKNLIPTKP